MSFRSQMLPNITIAFVVSFTMLSVCESIHFAKLSVAPGLCYKELEDTECENNVSAFSCDANSWCVETVGPTSSTFNCEYKEPDLGYQLPEMADPPTGSVSGGFQVVNNEIEVVGPTSGGPTAWTSFHTDPNPTPCQVVWTCKCISNTHEDPCEQDYVFADSLADAYHEGTDGDPCPVE